MDKKFCIIGGFVLLVALALGWGLSGLTKHVIVAVDNWGSAAPAITTDVHSIQQSLAPMPGLLTQATTTLKTTNTTIAKFQPVIANLNQTIIAINRPCNTKNTLGPFHTSFYSEGSVMPCGMFADGARTLEQFRLAAGTAVIAGNHEDKNLGKWDGIADHFDDLLSDGDDSITSFKDLLNRKSLADILDQVDGTMVHVNAITGKFELVTNKAAADYLAPQPWWKKVGRYAGDTYDYGALFARHTP